MNWQKSLIRMGLCAALLAAGLANAQTLPELKKVISDQLLYPRECRYTLPAVLPSEDADGERNSEWIAVSGKLAKSGLVRVSHAGRKTLLDGVEQSLDIVVPSMNLRYETTALNVILGRWEVDVHRTTKVGEVILVEGKRRVSKRTRAYEVVVPTLSTREAAKYSDRDVVWEISAVGASWKVIEKLK